MSERKDSLEWVSSTELGRKFIWDLVSFCGVYQDMAGDSAEVSRQLGKRSVGLHLLGEITQLDEELIFNMMREARNRALLKEIENANTNSRAEDADPEFDPLRELIGDTSYHTSDTGSSALRTYGSGDCTF